MRKYKLGNLLLETGMVLCYMAPFLILGAPLVIIGLILKGDK